MTIRVTVQASKQGLEPGETFHDVFYEVINNGHLPQVCLRSEPRRSACGKLSVCGSWTTLVHILRWLQTVSSIFQDVAFDGSLLPLFIS